MKIRTITAGIRLKFPLQKRQIEETAAFLRKAKAKYENKGFEVQTLRISTQPFETWKETDLFGTVKKLEEFANACGITYVSIGTARKKESLPLIYSVLKETRSVFCTALVLDGSAADYGFVRESAGTIRKISEIQSTGFSNLNFAVLFNVKAGSPFLPASYVKKPFFAIGTENSDLVVKAFARAGSPEKAGRELDKEFEIFKEIERIAGTLKNKKLPYGGIDCSIASSVSDGESVAYGFENLGLGKFGEAGTLAAARIVTAAINRVKVKKCGYSGLMLPVLEDAGLAKRNSEGFYNIQQVLLYSAVCGTGLDTIPLPGNVSEDKLTAILLDIAALSEKLGKPLSARLMPVPGKQAGQMTEYDFPYFKNSKIMAP